MRILFHTAGLLLFICLFLLGKLAIEHRADWADFLTLNRVSRKRISNFFFYGGTTFEAITSLFGFLEAVAILVLMSGWILEQAM
jgi:type IV secretory pathway VirB3-like protein